MHHNISHHLRPGDTAGGRIEMPGDRPPYALLEIGNLGVGGAHCTLFTAEPEQLREIARIAAGLAYELAAKQQVIAEAAQAPYRPWYPVVDGIETVTERFACCGAGVDQVDPSSGDRVHLPGCRSSVHPDLVAPSVEEQRDDLVDAGAFDEATS
jgi:hypothetical protein